MRADVRQLCLALQRSRRGGLLQCHVAECVAAYVPMYCRVVHCQRSQRGGLLQCHLCVVICFAECVLVYFAVCRGVLQCVAVCCIVWQCQQPWRGGLLQCRVCAAEWVAVYVAAHVLVRCSVLYRQRPQHGGLLQCQVCVAECVLCCRVCFIVCCSVLQCRALSEAAMFRTFAMPSECCNVRCIVLLFQQLLFWCSLKTNGRQTVICIASSSHCNMHCSITYTLQHALQHTLDTCHTCSFIVVTRRGADSIFNQSFHLSQSYTITYIYVHMYVQVHIGFVLTWEKSITRFFCSFRNTKRNTRNAWWTFQIINARMHQHYISSHNFSPYTPTNIHTHTHTHTHEQCPYQNRGCRLYLPNIALACCITQSRGRIWHVETCLQTCEQSHYHL